MKSILCTPLYTVQWLYSVQQYSREYSGTDGPGGFLVVVTVSPRDHTGSAQHSPVAAQTQSGPERENIWEENISLFSSDGWWKWFVEEITTEVPTELQDIIGLAEKPFPHPGRVKNWGIENKSSGCKLWIYVWRILRRFFRNNFLLRSVSPSEEIFIDFFTIIR